MPSFDAVIHPDLELRNAVEQANREIGTRFDFKGSVGVHHRAGGREITLFADSDFQIGQVTDILRARLAKRGVDLRYLDTSAKTEKIGGDKVRQAVTVKSGVPSDVAKKIQTLVKQSKLKVAAGGPGRQRARQRRQARRPAGGNRLAAAGTGRRAADLRELPQLSARGDMSRPWIRFVRACRGAAGPEDGRGSARHDGALSRHAARFSAFEREALSFCLKHAGARVPAYSQVERIADCDFIVADASHEAPGDSVTRGERMRDGRLRRRQAAARSRPPAPPARSTERIPRSMDGVARIAPRRPGRSSGRDVAVVERGTSLPGTRPRDIVEETTPAAFHPEALDLRLTDGGRPGRTVDRPPAARRRPPPLPADPLAPPPRPACPQRRRPRRTRRK